jgi:hypothetical protein
MKQRKRQARPTVEILEDRWVPTLAVTSDYLPVTTPQEHLIFQGVGSNQSVARAANGNFAVAWSDQGIYAKLFNASGQPLTNLVLVGDTDRWTSEPAVAMNDSGEFVIAWTHEYTATDHDIYVQRFDAAGQPRSASQVVAFSRADQTSPAVSMSADGDFVVAYREANSGVGQVRVSLFDSPASS